MFLDYLKNFVIKKIVNKALSGDVAYDNVGKIRNIGIIADEAFLPQTESLKKSLINRGILENDISIIIRSTSSQIGNCNYLTFSLGTVSKVGKFLNPKIQEFIDKDFDLLINYYEQEKPVSLMASALSKATFKVGFASVDKRINNLIINTSPHDFQVFEEELFKYLKILNRI